MIRALIVAAVLVLAGCSTEPPTPSAAQTWIGVFGPAISRWTTPQGMSLEVGDAGWSIAPGAPTGGLGVVATNLTETVRVRLVGVSDCHEYASFDAEPGLRYALRFGGLGDPNEVTVEEIDAIELGPGLNERSGGLTDCE